MAGVEIYAGHFLARKGIQYKVFLHKREVKNPQIAVGEQNVRILSEND